MAVRAKLLAAGLSDTGVQRDHNEDRIHVDVDHGIFMVIDGLGGHAAGERAAEVAREFVLARLSRQTGSTEERLREAIALANDEIYRLSRADPNLRGMACVLTVAVLEDDRATVGHVGDSRLYYLEPGNIRKLTHDHSPVGEREDAGELTEDAAMAHPRRNEVFRDVGSEPHAPDDEDFVEVVRFRLRENAAFLLCSDGLSDQVPSSRIRAMVEEHATDPKRAVAELVRAANAAGGKDNVSVVLVASPGFAARPARVAERPRVRRGFHPVLAFLAGLVIAAAAFALLRPYVERTPQGRALRFGTVQTPLTLIVGQGALPSITEALARSRPGDTVLVMPGIYRESIQLRQEVALISAESRGATIEGSGTVVLAESIAGARFTGFRITGDADVGIRIVNSAVEANDVEIRGMRQAAIVIEGQSLSAVRASRISGNAGTGIVVAGGARPLLSHNVITQNGRVPNQPRPGLHIVDAAAPVVSGNIIMENGVEQIWTSPLFHAGSLFTTNVIAPGARDRTRQVRVISR